MNNPILASALALLAWCFPLASIFAQTNAKQKEVLEQMLQMFPKSEAWDSWLQTARVLPLNFQSLPSIPFLPDPLRFEGGKEVKSREEWPKRRQAILTSFQQYIIG